MPKSIFTAIDPAGVTHKRTSDRRVYSHTVVFLPCFNTAMIRADRDYKHDAENFVYHVACAAGTHRNVNHVTPTSGYHASYTADQVAEMQTAQRESNARAIANAKTLIAGHTVESYVAEMRADRVADVRKQEADGYFRTYQNAGWCGRLDLAQKLAASCGGLSVTILPAVKKEN